MSNTNAHIRVGVYVDVPNMYRNGGQRMRYDVLREFACRDEAEALRLNAYISYDVERSREDTEYEQRAKGFHSALRDLGYKVIVKNVQWYQDEAGEWVSKGNADLDLAVDALLQSENLDRVLLASGDRDFGQVVRALQNKGCRVEVIALENVSENLRNEADLFFSGFLIPNLIPSSSDRQAKWGEIGARVRGWCYWHHHEESYGFMRYLTRIAPGLWLTDTRNPELPYETVFFHDSNLPDRIRAGMLPNRNIIFEFKLIEADRGEGFQAVDITVASRI